MRTIVEGNKNVMKLLGKQKIKNTMYRKLIYILQVECDDGILLHNTMTGQLILLNEMEYALITKLPASSMELSNSLIEDYFLVPEDYNERATVEKLRFMLERILMPKGINNYVIYTTTRCNARCYYCFESEYKRIDMSVETGEKIAYYMISNKAEGPLYLSWFGGEPLVGIRRIDQICKILKEKGIEYYSDLTSNGYLFSEEVIDRSILDWKLRSVQITLDGTEEVYNKTKSYISPIGSPYRRVLNNIESLLKKGIRVIIRLNLSQDNIEDIEKLIHELKNGFMGYQNLNVYVHVVIKNLGFNPITRNETEENNLYRQQVRLSEKLVEFNLAKRSHKLPSLKVISCMADHDGAVAIYPNGYMYKCQHFDENDYVGSIYSDSKKSIVYSKYREKFKSYLCDKCYLFPSCLLLDRCPGREKPNVIMCQYDIEQKKNDISLYYKEKNNI